MSEMTCIIVDDEPKAIDILELFISKISYLKLSAKFRDPVSAAEHILKHKPDLVFTDISMPEITGLQLIKSLSFQPLIIFTTAFSEHAVESYDLNAVDYLLKPIQFDRFLKAVMKAKDKFELLSVATKPSDDEMKHFENTIYIKSGSKTFRINVEDILFIEGMGNYVTFNFSDKKVVSYMSMQEVEDVLSATLFYRVHKSYIVSIKHIDSIELHQIKIQNHLIPVGKTYWDDFSKVIRR